MSDLLTSQLSAVPDHSTAMADEEMLQDFLLDMDFDELVRLALCRAASCSTGPVVRHGVSRHFG